jgi:hypothetical protein
LEAVSTIIYKLILELQALASVKPFSLAGGTNLALRFNHRKSVDIDLFSNTIIGVDGFEALQKELHQHFADDLLFCQLENADAGNQFCFLKSLIKRGTDFIKVEFLQNFQHLDDPEISNGIRLFSVKDIGLFKLRSASGRKAKKDIYDLDYITDEIPLADLLISLQLKTDKFESDEFKCLFDLDNEVSPLQDLSLLLSFDDIDYTELPSRPSHSNDTIEITEGFKSWTMARASWRRKVKDYMRQKGITPPPVKPVN